MMNRRDQVMEFILTYKEAHDGNSPTVREIAAGYGIPSTSNVVWWLRRLEAEGWLRVEETGTSRRRIMVVGGKWLYVPGVAG